MIIITSKQDGFRRCGMAHPATPTEHPDGVFTPEQIEILHNEPMLVVLEAEADKDKLPGLVTGAADKIAFIKTVSAVDQLDALAEGETRKTVLDALNARRKELEA